MILNQTYINMGEIVSIHYRNQMAVISFKNKEDSLMIPCYRAQYDDFLDEIEKNKESN